MQELIANRTWNNFHWPEWVPEKVKKQIIDFHCDEWGRGPANWLEGAVRNKAPRFGDRVRVEGLSGQKVEGRFVFAWNNIGRVITDDEGHYECVGFQPFEVSRNGLWCKPTPDDFSTVANTTCTGLADYVRQSDTFTGRIFPVIEAESTPSASR